jgi:hypothetical protein
MVTAPAPLGARSRLRAGSLAALATATLASFASAAPAEAAATLRRVFVTSIADDGDLDGWDLPGGVTVPIFLQGVTIGDFICRTLAAHAGLAEANTYRAWLSDSDDDAFCRAQGLSGLKALNCGQGALPTAGGPWARLDNLPFLDSVAVLELDTSWRALTPVRLDERGDPAPALSQIWTGTDSDGESTGFTCDDWSSSSPADQGIAGSPHETGTSWNFGRSPSCDSPAKLLCLLPGPGPAPPSGQRPGRRAFSTSVIGNGILGSWPDAGGVGLSGIAAGDAICRRRAAIGGLAFPDSFKAWLSDASIDARDRFSEGAFVRVDGFLLASSVASLTDGVLGTAIDRSELGALPGSNIVWTGTDADGTFDGQNCLGWLSGDVGPDARAGSNLETLAGWTSQRDEDCLRQRSLYCISDAAPDVLFADGFEGSDEGVPRWWGTTVP